MKTCVYICVKIRFFLNSYAEKGHTWTLFFEKGSRKGKMHIFTFRILGNLLYDIMVHNGAAKSRQITSFKCLQKSTKQVIESSWDSKL